MMNKLLSSLLVMLLFFNFFSSNVFATKILTGGENDYKDQIPGGSLQVLGSDDVKEFPLKHTDVNVEISGFISRVEVTQEFFNPYNETIEAVYIFPLSNSAAVDSMEFLIGDKVIKGVIKTREEAQQIYQQAKQQGRRAGLLEQQRPNIFTQSVANIKPGDKILVKIKYVEILDYEDGKHSFVFPMVVGPRYMPPTMIENINPLVLKPGERSGHDISLTINLDAGVNVKDITSKAHKVDVEKLSDTKALITLSKEDSIPNKDFVLEYFVAGEKPQFAVLTHKTGEEGFFTLMIQPQLSVDASEVTPKEMIFVVDTSGSMSGEPINKVKEAMRFALKNMNPDDSFQIIRFSDMASGLSDMPLKNTPENVKRGLEFIDKLYGEGGTNMLSGIKASLDYPQDPKRIRIVLFMTDGYIGNEAEILSAIQQRLGSARLFSFGIGSSVNRYLLDEMANAGKGAVHYVLINEDTQQAVEKFYNRIRNPYLTDISIDWNGLDVKDVYPEKIPDLFSSQPVFVYGKYNNAGSGVIKIKEKIAGKDFIQEILVKLPESISEHKGLDSVWARQKIKHLMSKIYSGEDKEIVQQITDLGLKFNLMTQYTSFVAVEEDVVANPDGTFKTVQVPVPIPEGVSYEGIFGDGMAEQALMYKSAPRSASVDVGGYRGNNNFVQSVSKTNQLVTSTTSNNSTANANQEESLFIMKLLVIAVIFIIGLVVLVIYLVRK